MDSKIKLAPSILSADFARLGEQVAEVTKAGADYIHIDVMDGHFVSNITIGAPVVASLSGWTDLPLDVHLMIEQPERYISDFANSGANIITVHVEVCPHLHRTIQAIKELGVRPGVALNPATPLSSIEEIIPYVSLILIMSVNPGFGGQAFIPETLGKISRLRQMLEDKKLPTELEVDGGITNNNALTIVKAGANVLAVGNSVFKAKEGISQALQKIREIAEGKLQQSCEKEAI
jgi:ribulose-phosphate 3-epimerase